MRLASALACVTLVALVWPDAARAWRRNGVYLTWFRTGAFVGTPDEPPEASRPEALLALRRALDGREWDAVDRWLGRSTRPDRLAPYVVIHQAGVWRDAGQREDAVRALTAVDRHAGRDPMVWYRVGEAWEDLGATDRARSAYAAGAASDPASPWSEGRYRLAVLDRREQQWAAVVEQLSVLLTSASDGDLARTVRHLQLGGGIWQEALLTLGEAYERLGRAPEAEAVYSRMAAIADPRRDWTLNRGLVALARLAAARGDFDRAAPAIERALTLAAGFDLSHRATYERDTAGAAAQLMQAAAVGGHLPPLRARLAARAQEASTPAAWYVAALAAAAMCDGAETTAAVDRARALAAAGTAVYLAEPLPPMPGCAAR